MWGRTHEGIYLNEVAKLSFGDGVDMGKYRRPAQLIALKDRPNSLSDLSVHYSVSHSLLRRCELLSSQLDGG